MMPVGNVVQRAQSNSFDYCVDNIVMQPITLCNLNCTYCYLPLKETRRVMSEEVARSIANWINQTQRPTRISWHCGEPLSCGTEHFSSLIQPFHTLQQRGIVVHVMQTNATLLNASWCLLLKRAGFEVSVSIDGPRQMNHRRINWANAEAHSRILKGIAHLREAEIPFSALAVVAPDADTDTVGFYDFFKFLGCRALGINIEEAIGINETSGVSESDVERFWATLFELWREEPVIRIREFDHVLSWVTSLADSRQMTRHGRAIDLIPTVGYDGDVVLLSPEFLQVPHSSDTQFVVGNVTREPIEEIMKRVSNVNYVGEYFAGRQRCSKECDYFSACGGGTAANKFFEHHSICVTETAFCRNSEKLLIEAVLDRL